MLYVPNFQPPCGWLMSGCTCRDKTMIPMHAANSLSPFACPFLDHQAPSERHQEHAAPPELVILAGGFYKYAAPLALGKVGASLRARRFGSVGRGY
jgi:hypothetical protein